MEDKNKTNNNHNHSQQANEKNESLAVRLVKLFWRPISCNGPFFVFMYVLGMAAAAGTVVYSALQTLYDNAWLELFLDLYIICVVLTVLPRIARKIARAVCYLIAYPLSLIDVYCLYKFDSPINPTMLMLVNETDSREAGEFLQSYMSPDMLGSWVGVVLLILLVHILWTLCRHKAAKWLATHNATASVWEKLTSLKARMASQRTPLTVAASLLTVILLTVSATQCWHNKDRAAYLMTRTSIGDVEHALTEKDRWEMFLPTYRLAFSLYANHLTAQQLTVLHRVAHNVSVDSCSVTSPNIVLIIGEAYNKHHSQLYGYPMPTTPRQLQHSEKGRLVPFTDVVSPWNLTSYVFKHIMSTYAVGDKGDWCDYPLFGELFRKAGYHVTFLTNEFLSKPKEAVYDFSGGFFLNDPVLSEAQFNTRNTQLHVFDESLLIDYDNLKPELYGTHKDDIDSDTVPHLTIFHLIGQHFNYRIRCPNKKKHFRPEDYDRPDLNKKWLKNLSDYDNATLYNDSILDQIIQRFEDTNTIIIHMPDHGEEVHSPELPHFCGRMHSSTINRRLAREEFEIPFWIWCSAKYMHSHPDIYHQIVAARNLPYMTDALPHLLLYLAGIHSKYYRPDLNILAPQYDAKRPRILKHQTDYDKVMTGE